MPGGSWYGGLGFEVQGFGLGLRVRAFSLLRVLHGGFRFGFGFRGFPSLWFVLGFGLRVRV